MNKCSNLFRFKVGDEYLVWRVISRELDQILMAWEYKGLKVCLYFFHFIFKYSFNLLFLPINYIGRAQFLYISTHYPMSVINVRFSFDLHSFPIYYYFFPWIRIIFQFQ